MTLFEGKTFTKETVQLDGGQFRDCTFDHCTLLFGGNLDAMEITGCTFINCEWAFVDAAWDTLGFLAMLYEGLGEEGARLVEQMFDSVRKQAIAIKQAHAVMAQAS